MTCNLRVEPSEEQDLPRLMEIILPSFEAIRFSQLVGDTWTPENALAAGQRHLYAWREHAKEYKTPMGVKCIHTDPSTEKETIVSSAEWIIYDRVRTEAEYLTPSYLLNAEWVTDPAAQKEARDFMRPCIDSRIRWMGDRPHGLLVFMATDEKYRGQGAAKKCVQWGMDRCAELGIPAILEASEMGTPVYQSLGWEIVDRIVLAGWELPVLIWWPPGWKEEDKKPAMPDWKN